MPTPEREVEPQSPPVEQPSASAVSMKDLLASCAAASAVSTPPRRGERPDAEEEPEHPAARRDAA
ncbi:hypothetical protein ACIPJG_08590 [Streptomyces halstedii]|uniref:Uncharacterized protein n=1 Tax=Streptomyces halstedii TaxID=1944 RepID=A0A6N9U7Q7_STRHA|nr:MULTISPECIES: hypothetical protein [Streptomyces]KDQ69017.1 hypothetical protein DT87_18065 [Streptomyces sp. NTK 937]MBV7670471.1 hypothetical protein [Streptomyces halstedii]MCW8215722.1 hypothetical protein [Streptomyces griseolus]MYQ50092.1 hypothetical protein [Streptomyces sp. SID4941]MYR74647.1 hypothetical protein [Streptomyces sp. SID4925]